MRIGLLRETLSDVTLLASNFGAGSTAFVQLYGAQAATIHLEQKGVKRWGQPRAAMELQSQS
jgi:hypothetical protein